MTFKKGNIPWNKGLIKETDERVAKLGRKGERKGRFKKGHAGYFKDKHFSKEHRKNLSKALRGKRNAFGYRYTEEQRRKLSKSKKGKKRIPFSKEHKRKLSESRRGEKNHQWIDGSSFEPYGIEFNEGLKEQIRKRDNYRCQQCFRHQDELYNKTGKKYKLHVHHIDYDKKNNKPENLISLCMSCHLQTNFGRDDWTNYFNQKVKQL